MNPLEKMTEAEVQERMNQLYGEYTQYWNELMRRRKKHDGKTTKTTTKDLGNIDDMPLCINQY